MPNDLYDDADLGGNGGGVHDVMNALRIARTDDEVEIRKATESTPTP